MRENNSSLGVCHRASRLERLFTRFVTCGARCDASKAIPCRENRLKNGSCDSTVLHVLKIVVSLSTFDFLASKFPKKLDSSRVTKEK